MNDELFKRVKRASVLAPGYRAQQVRGRVNPLERVARCRVHNFDLIAGSYNSIRSVIGCFA